MKMDSRFIDVDSVLREAMGSVTVIVDGVNGNDPTADGTAQRPYKTIAAACRYFPGKMNTDIAIKAGTYVESAIQVTIPYRITLRSYSGSNDVIIELSGNQKEGITCGSLSSLTLRNLTLKKGSESTMQYGISFWNTQSGFMYSCTLQGFDSRGVNCGFGALYVQDCTFSESPIAIVSSIGAIVYSYNNSGSMTQYGLMAENLGRIMRAGTQPTGSTANIYTATGGQII